MGAALFAVKRCSPMRVRMPAQDSRSTYALLYLPAVRDDWHKQEHCQDHVDIDPCITYGSGGSWPTSSLPALVVVRVGPWSTSGPQIPTPDQRIPRRRASTMRERSGWSDMSCIRH